MWSLVLVVGLTVCSSVTLPTWGEPRHGSDKVLHLLLFGLLANFLGQIESVRRCRPLGIYTAVLLVSLFGLLDELHQQFTPGRSVDVWDWAADTGGAVVATWLYQHCARYRYLFTSWMPGGSVDFRRAWNGAAPGEEVGARAEEAVEPAYSAGSAG